MEHAVQVFAAVSFLVIRLSHLLQPNAWVAFFQALAAAGLPGAFLDGFLYLQFGALIVAFHNVWHGPALVLTLIGWSQVLKGRGVSWRRRLGSVCFEAFRPSAPGISRLRACSRCW